MAEMDQVKEEASKYTPACWARGLPVGSSLQGRLRVIGIPGWVLRSTWFSGSGAPSPWAVQHLARGNLRDLVCEGA